jgi:hypothetical protein
VPASAPAPESLAPEPLPILPLRKSRGLSLEKLGQKLNLSASYISLIERQIFHRPRVERKIRRYLLRRKAVR